MDGRMHGHQPVRHRGVIAVFVLVMMVVIVGFAALVIDAGLLHVAKADLQRAADAAALAATSACFTDAALLEDDFDVARIATERAQYTSLHNSTLRQETVAELGDIAVGRHDFAQPFGALSNSGRFNAVEVTVRRTADSTNGPVPYHFARVWGRESGDVTARARAAMDDRFVGVDVYKHPPLLPLTIRDTLYDEQWIAGADDYSYDGGVHHMSDGIREIQIFPVKIKKDDPEADGAGNFGLLNIDGTGNALQVRQQIRENISPDELANEFGVTELRYYDEGGQAVTYEVSGTTGLKASIEGDLRDRVGDIVGFFIHSDAREEGNNAYFTNTGLRFGRIMSVELGGNSNALVIQPVAYTGGAVIVGSPAPASDGMVGQVFLVQ